MNIFRELWVYPNLRQFSQLKIFYFFKRRNLEEDFPGVTERLFVFRFIITFVFYTQVRENKDLYDRGIPNMKIPFLTMSLGGKGIFEHPNI